MTGVQILHVPEVAELLSANHRRHWRAEAPLKAVWRHTGATLARQARLAPYGAQRVRVVATIHRPTRRRYDAANLHPTLKCLIDGITDAGVLTDDDNAHLFGPFAVPGEVRKPPCIVLTFTPCAPGDSV